ncbi:hypothetical protein ABZ916_43480 [Streptomyces sp. NPDC046853]|uniref:hypothetical protein n=1 Tax=Streptomyces sp. NPDC046853 TaxID=3154920 RepID=UPI0033C2EF4B
MAFSDADRANIIKALDKIDEASQEAILATLTAFANWLKDVLRGVYKRIRDDIARIWKIIRNIFW